MADYREISQQYAQGAIKAGILLNGGAAVALLSQVSDLIDAGLANQIRWPMILWAAGTTLSAATWQLAFLSTRYVDKHEREEVERHLDAADRYMRRGLLALVGALLAFIAGCVVLACSFGTH